ncbi:DUF2231 domain-containing protein [Pseudonocardia endophytica]|uniref:Uncharacterized protein n=1 Tax=Pseudonocardia endophytica TaxID=401976 RepID=A0A4R1HIX4_PSEEN|nr:DUF2231 domain-containing protein [Pseudonocardia endophytica]TCK20260.1 hypothetical protein EV378_4215 [Pseudonocardia endophytica]
MSTIDGLPAHILLVHAVVVLVPLSALLILLVAFWPAARRRLVWPTAILSVVALIFVPLTTEAGEWLEQRVARTPLVSTHTEIGDTMLPWAIAMAVVAMVLLGRHLLGSRRSGGRDAPGAATATGPGTTSGQPGGTVVTVVVGLLAVVVAAGSVFTVYRIGESGARAAWTGQFSQQARVGPP